MRSVALLLTVVCLGSDLCLAQEGQPELPRNKRTTLGLYVSPAKAHALWKANPDRVKILDVRTPEEYLFVGHAPMARNVPVYLVETTWNPKRKRPTMRPNPRFLEQARQGLKPDDTIIMMCRSGSRSARAADLLAQAGFTKVYNLYEGFEGDMVRDKESPNVGKRKKNGWKNAGLPWTYALDADLVYRHDASPPGKAAVSALEAALRDARQGRARYRKMSETFGPERLYQRLVGEEERNLKRIQEQLTALGAAPKKSEPAEAIKWPDSLEAALIVAIDIETERAKRYERQLDGPGEASIGPVLSPLCDALRARVKELRSRLGEKR